MRSGRLIHTVESHTEGMPTRVVTAGVPMLGGATMAERRAIFMAHYDDVRRFLMSEPRGHSAMSGAIVQASTRADADVGVIFIEASGCLPMCGHGAIGVATVLVETGQVSVTEPVTVVRLDTPAGLVTAQVNVNAGVATSVTIENVASFAVDLDVESDVPGIGVVRYDVAFGGNFYAIIDAALLGIDFDNTTAATVIEAGMAFLDAVNRRDYTHPTDPTIRQVHHAALLAPEADAHLSRHAMVIRPGWIDRSPCGTGTSARMAQLHARDALPLKQPYISQSFIGSRFTGELTHRTTVAGMPAVVPRVTGRAWITGTASFFLDPDDPYPAGFTL